MRVPIAFASREKLSMFMIYSESNTVISVEPESDVEESVKAFDLL